MGVSGRPGKFPATLVAVSNGSVTFKADPKDIVYLKNQVGQSGELDWNPSSYKPHAGDKESSAG
jgi:hypothetical protein